MEPRGTIIVVDDEQNILRTLKIYLESVNFLVDAYLDPVEASVKLSEKEYDIAFFDLKMSPIDGMQLLKECKQKSPNTTVVIITAHGSIQSAVEAIKNGAEDFLQKPFDMQEFQLFTERVFEYHKLKKEVRYLRQQIEETKEEQQFISRDPEVLQLLDIARQIADSNLNVLIEGESGTGKEMLAKFIHNCSNRRNKPFIKVSCAAFPETLLESELFGHVKGAFTGAMKDRTGRFEAADGGTILLDEIGELPQNIQVKLLRFLQSKEFERLGENLTRCVDVRVIAATNRNLTEALQSGAIREDLYYRLNAVKFKLPPLRERPGDVLILIQFFIKKYGGGKQYDLSDDALKLLTTYRWPGNIRELENVIERCLVFAKDGVIRSEYLPDEIKNADLSISSILSLEEMEKLHIKKVLGVAKDLDEAANLLGIDPTTLWRKRKKYNL
ncbi:MAG: Type IV fimbriae expression regulatory protein PilR [Ignavibacteriae bacterium]|nr:MAG: Type IV fimbriae expression regulatory protein PilR [Ignavibacteriota bacterium]